MADKKLEAVILANEVDNDHLLWIKACEVYCEEVNFRVVSLVQANWLKEILQRPFDVLLAKPGGFSDSFKRVYDERIMILSGLGYKIFPSLQEILIYENKRFLAAWLEANKVPHPATAVFYNLDESLAFISASKFPMVAKSNIGASGSGVFLLQNRTEAEEYIRCAFSGKGVQRRTGPNLKQKRLFPRGIHYVLHPGDIRKKLTIYRLKASDPQSKFVILQEFVKHDFEWRVVRTGNSFYAHKKLIDGFKASGSLLKAYETPPYGLLEFVKDLTDKHGFFSQAVDVFEVNEKFLVNEMQCIFGQSDPYQMLVDDKPGRFLKIKNEWIFEPGLFNTNECFNERLEFVISMFKEPRQ